MDWKITSQRRWEDRCLPFILLVLQSTERHWGCTPCLCMLGAEGRVEKRWIYWELRSSWWKLKPNEGVKVKGQLCYLREVPSEAIFEPSRWGEPDGSQRQKEKQRPRDGKGMTWMAIRSRPAAEWDKCLNASSRRHSLSGPCNCQLRE